MLADIPMRDRGRRMRKVPSLDVALAAALAVCGPGAGLAATAQADGMREHAAPVPVPVPVPLPGLMLAGGLVLLAGMRRRARG